MTQKQSNRKDKILLLLSIVGLLICITVLFPQVRRLIIHSVEQIIQKEFFLYQSWINTLLSYAIGGICFILFFDYCTLTNSGRMLIQNVKQEIKDCLSEIDFRSFRKPVFLLSIVYLLGILTIIRANFLYMDEISWSVTGHREWYNWSRYITIFLSYLVQPEISLTDISPIPQLLAAFILSCSSVLLIYIIGNKKITVVRLLASIPLGLFPYFLESLSYKYVSGYGAFVILVSFFPFLFIARKKAFFFCSFVSLLIVCMINQITVNIYMMIVLIICFQDWNSRKKPQKEILYFLGSAAIAFCSALLVFKFFLMIPRIDSYAATTMHPFSNIIIGTFNNIKNYALVVNHDLGLIWKIGIAIVILFFIIKSIHQSERKKLLSFIATISVIVLSFILSYGLYSLLATPVYFPRHLCGFSVFLAILCIIVVSDNKKIASVVVLALNWCLFVFAFSYGNALADQARYAEFRIGILLHDLSVLYPSVSEERMTFQLKNSIDYAPSIENVAKNYPVIKRLVPKRLGEDTYWDYKYLLYHFNYDSIQMNFEPSLDLSTLDLPVVLDSYYHTIQSDGSYMLITLKH